MHRDYRAAATRARVPLLRVAFALGVRLAVVAVAVLVRAEVLELLQGLVADLGGGGRLGPGSSKGSRGA
jgi:hypothetical protein